MPYRNATLKIFVRKQCIRVTRQSFFLSVIPSLVLEEHWRESWDLVERLQSDRVGEQLPAAVVVLNLEGKGEEEGLLRNFFGLK